MHDFYIERTKTTSLSGVVLDVNYTLYTIDKDGNKRRIGTNYNIKGLTDILTMLNNEEMTTGKYTILQHYTSDRDDSGESWDEVYIIRGLHAEALRAELDEEDGNLPSLDIYSDNGHFCEPGAIWHGSISIEERGTNTVITQICGYNI